MSNSSTNVKPSEMSKRILILTFSTPLYFVVLFGTDQVVMTQCSSHEIFCQDLKLGKEQQKLASGPQSQGALQVFSCFTTATWMHTSETTAP